MAALDGAFAFAQRDHLAVMVAEDLDLDVARAGEIFLEEDAAVAEGRLSLARGGFERGFEAGASGTTRMPRPPPPAAAFTRIGKPGLFGELARCGQFAGIDAGTTGTSAATAMRRAATSSPSAAITSAGGSDEDHSWASTARANSGRSERKP